MKNVMGVFLVSLMFLASTVHAAENTCGLPDGYDSDTYEDVGLQKSIKPEMKMNRLEAVQILIAARSQAKRSGEGPVSTVESAIKYLTENSEAGDAYIGRQRANGTVYTVVLYFPGGNPYGLIFNQETTKVLGYIEDSSVVCK